MDKKRENVFLNWMYITMQHSKGRGVQVWSHLPRDSFFGQDFSFDLYKLHCNWFASALVRGHLKLHII